MGHQQRNEVTMKIKMLQTRKGTEDGYTVAQFYEGKEYDVREVLAYRFAAKGYAEIIKQDEA